jgi:molybdate transport system substrate-binding protein
MSGGGLVKIRSSVAAATIGIALSLVQGLAAEAAEVKVIAGVAIRPVMEELGPQFERATGHKLAIWYGVTGPIQRRMAAAEAFDLATLGPPLMDEYIRQGKIAADTRTEIARIGYAVGGRAGAPKPDISSVDAFKRALLNTKSVAYNPEGAGGIHAVRVFERLGIAEQMTAKLKPVVTKSVVEALAEGNAELAVAFTNSFQSVRGVELIGPFPPELQRYILVTAGVATAAKQPEAAKALIKFLTSPAAIAVIKAKGMEPATP